MVVHCIYSQIGVVGQRAKSNGKRGEGREGGLTGSTKNEEGSREGRARWGVEVWVLEAAGIGGGGGGVGGTTTTTGGGSVV